MNTDILAHYLFAAASFVVAYLFWLESKKLKNKNNLSRYWIAIGLTFGVLYFCLLWYEGTRLTVFSELDTHSKQHIIISISLIFSGILGVIYRNNEKIWKLIRIFFILMIGFISLIHLNHHSHNVPLIIADWLQPYHKILGALLLLAGGLLIFELLVKTKKSKKRLILSCSITFIITGLLLVAYKNPYSYGEIITLEPCDTAGKSIIVEINNKKISPQDIIAKRCDNLILVVTDDSRHYIAFGRHDQHSQYPGFKEQKISKGKDIKVLLAKNGLFVIHNHDNEKIKSILTVRD